MKRIFFVISLFLIFYGGQAQWLKELTGPIEVCPGTVFDGPNYTFTAKSYVSGCFSWAVYEDGAWTPPVLPGCGCSGLPTSKSSSFTYHFNNTTGPAKVRVYFLPTLSILCNHSVLELDIVKRVFGPGEPYDLDGGDISLCPGETKTVYIPGVPGDTLNTATNCYWHYKWDWLAPAGWSINGGNSQERTDAIQVQLTAPSNATPGSYDELIVESEPLWPHYVESSGDIRVGYSEDVTMTGSSLLCTSNSTYTIQNLPAGTSVNWSVSPASLFAVDTGTGTSFTTRATNSSSSGQGTITATLSGNCGNVTIEQSVWVGKPGSPRIIDIPSSICAEEVVQLAAYSPANEPSNNYVYQWTFSGETPTIHYESLNSNLIEISYCDTGNKTVSVREVSTCGSSTAASTSFLATYCPGVGPAPGADCGSGSSG